MAELLIIADDFTGALDTGVKFAAAGIDTRVIADGDGGWKMNPQWAEAAVLVVDAETRHLPPADAARAVFDIAAGAAALGAHYVYKKTDSALRGNIGAELAAALLATNGKRLHFFPAFPGVGRTTLDGIHYIDGVPVAASIFGSDPFEPVCQSDVLQIISAQTDRPVYRMGGHIPDGPLPDGILVYDSTTPQQMESIAHRLFDRGELTLCAGCAGLAGSLPHLLNLPGRPLPATVFTPQLLTLCGSVNPITTRQIEAATERNVPRLSLTQYQQTTSGWTDTLDGARWVDDLRALCRQEDEVIVDIGADSKGLGPAFSAEARRQIPKNIGHILKALLNLGLQSTVLITGGDTLIGAMNTLGVRELRPVRELYPGVVLSAFTYQGQTHELISKSGGFGPRDLLENLARDIRGEIRERLKC